jgi:hypothetical protein
MRRTFLIVMASLLGLVCASQVAPVQAKSGGHGGGHNGHAPARMAHGGLNHQASKAGGRTPHAAPNRHVGKTGGRSAAASPTHRSRNAVSRTGHTAFNSQPGKAGGHTAHATPTRKTGKTTGHIAHSGPKGQTAHPTKRTAHTGPNHQANRGRTVAAGPKHLAGNAGARVGNLTLNGGVRSGDLSGYAGQVYGRPIFDGNWRGWHHRAWSWQWNRWVYWVPEEGWWYWYSSDAQAFLPCDDVISEDLTEDTLAASQDRPRAPVMLDRAIKGLPSR